MGVAVKYSLHKHEDLTHSLEYIPKARHDGDPSAGDWRQIDSWGPLAIQFGLFGDLEANESSFERTRWLRFEEQQSRLTSGFHRPLTLVHLHKNTHTHAMYGYVPQHTM